MSMRVTMVTVLMGSNGQSLWASLNVNCRLDLCCLWLWVSPLSFTLSNTWQNQLSKRNDIFLAHGVEGSSLHSDPLLGVCGEVFRDRAEVVTGANLLAL